MRKDVIIEKGVIAGNLFDKHGSRNVIVRHLMKRFYDALDALVEETGVSSIHEVGCGEGNLCIRLARQNYRIRGSDFSEQVVDVARKNSEADGLEIPFKAASIFDLEPENDRAELVLCSEVLEHLERPVDAVVRLAGLSDPYCLVSVPHEPLWSALNIMRGKYLARLGNTPGHVQRWNKNRFLELLSNCFEIVHVAMPIPWIMVLCRSKPI